MPPELQTDEVMHPIEAVRNPILKSGVDYWNALRGARRFPARAEMTLRGLAPLLPYSVIVAAIDGGADYVYRYVGDAQRQAFGAYFKGLRVSQIEAGAPELGATLRAAYDQVRVLGRPFVVRVKHNPDPSDPKPYYECMFLPLGTDDAAVDHLLIVGIRIPTPFWKLKTDNIERLVGEALSGDAA